MAKMHFRVAAMNAGKSTYLLQIAHNYEENGNTVRLLTASVDDRYGVGKITSRLGISRDAETFTPQTSFKALLEDTNVACVLIDEAQFMTTKQAKELHEWVHTKNIPAICFGLRSDFRGDPFPGAATLLALADNIEEIKTICSCGKKATMNIRTDENGQRVTEGEQVSIGGNDRYRPVCGRCFYKQ